MLGREMDWKDNLPGTGQGRKRKDQRLTTKSLLLSLQGFDAVVSKNSKKKERGKVFDFRQVRRKDAERNHWITDDRMVEVEEVLGSTSGSWKGATGSTEGRAQAGADAVDRY